MPWMDSASSPVGRSSHLTQQIHWRERPGDRKQFGFEALEHPPLVEAQPNQTSNTGELFVILTLVRKSKLLRILLVSNNNEEIATFLYDARSQTKH